MQNRKQMGSLLMHGGQITAQATKDDDTFKSPNIADDLLLDLHHPDIVLSSVVITSSQLDEELPCRLRLFLSHSQCFVQRLIFCMQVLVFGSQHFEFFDKLIYIHARTLPAFFLLHKPSRAFFLRRLSSYNRSFHETVASDNDARTTCCSVVLY